MRRPNHSQPSKEVAQPNDPRADTLSKVRKVSRPIVCVAPNELDHRAIRGPTLTRIRPIVHTPPGPASFAGSSPSVAIVRSDGRDHLGRNLKRATSPRPLGASARASSPRCGPHLHSLVSVPPVIIGIHPQNLPPNPHAMRRHLLFGGHVLWSNFVVDIIREFGFRMPRGQMPQLYLNARVCVAITNHRFALL